MEQLKKYKISQEQTRTLEDSINALTKEMENITPIEGPSIVKQKVLNSIFSILVDNVLRALPKTAEVLPLFSPLAPFNKLIGESVEHLVNAIRNQA